MQRTPKLYSIRANQTMCHSKRGAQAHSTWCNSDQLESPQRRQNRLLFSIATRTSQRFINQRGIYDGLCRDALRQDSSLGICGISTLSPPSPFFQLTHSLSIVSHSSPFTFFFSIDCGVYKTFEPFVKSFFIAAI